MDTSKKRQIRNLLFVVGNGVLIAFLFSALLLYKYSPTGQYEIQNVLLSPNIMGGLNFNDKNTKTGGMSRFVFDEIQFKFDDLQKGKNTKVLVSNAQYEMFYNKVRADKSLRDVSDEIKNEFNKGHSSNLKILIRTESPASWQALVKVFQEVDFSSHGSYYRVQLRESDLNSNYAYFYHENIYQITLELFTLIKD